MTKREILEGGNSLKREVKDGEPLLDTKKLEPANAVRPVKGSENTSGETTEVSGGT